MIKTMESWVKVSNFTENVTTKLIEVNFEVWWLFIWDLTYHIIHECIGRLLNSLVSGYISLCRSLHTPILQANFLVSENSLKKMKKNYLFFLVFKIDFKNEIFLRELIGISIRTHINHTQSSQFYPSENKAWKCTDQAKEEKYYFCDLYTLIKFKCVSI